MHLFTLRSHFLPLTVLFHARIFSHFLPIFTLSVLSLLWAPQQPNLQFFAEWKENGERYWILCKDAISQLNSFIKTLLRFLKNCM